MAEHAAALVSLETNHQRLSARTRDSRAQDIYASERGSLSFREAMRLLAKGWQFFAAHRRLVVIKSAIAISSMLLFLITPWPMKIIIDNVIDAHPLTGVPGRILLPLVGTDRIALLMLIVAFLTITVILTGHLWRRSSLVDTEVGSGGLDQAGASGGAANNGWSLWNGLLGLIETYVTLDLSQRVNQDLRTAIYTRFLRSPLGLYSDQKIGDAVFRVMNDSAGISEVFYRGMLAPIMSITMFVCALSVITSQFSNEPMIPIACATLLPLIAIGRRVLQPRLPRSLASDARAGQRHHGGIRGASRQRASHQGVRHRGARNRHRRCRKLEVLRRDAQVHRLHPRDGGDPGAADSLSRHERALSSVR